MSNGGDSAQGTTLRRHLLIVVLSALVPLLLVSVALAALLARSERERMEHSLQESARLLGHALDGELERSISALMVLAEADSLRSGDLRTFYERASRARRDLGIWDNVILLSPTADHLLNLRRPFGEPLPPVPQPEGALEATRTKVPFFSNVLQGRIETDWLVYMTVPVIIDGGVRYVLGATMSSQYWSRWLTERAPRDVTASISGRDMNVLARTRDAERTLGKPLTPWYQELLRQREHGFARGDGILAPDLVAAWQRSRASGWTVNIFTSATVVDLPMRQTAVLLAMGLLITLLLAAALAVSRGRLLTRGVERLEAALDSLKGPKPAVPRPTTPVTEFNRALVSAAETARVLESRDQALREADRRKDEFLAMLAHELRGPMAPIRNAVEVLRLPSADLEAKADARAIIERQVEHMRRLVDDLLDLARITRGEIRLERRAVDLTSIVQGALETTRPLFDKAGVRLHVELPRERIALEADTTRLVQVLANLLGNSAKFTPRGGNTWLAARKDGDWVEVQVRDDGIGIEAARLPHVFDMFSRPQGKPRAGDGLGIGLALVRGLVEQHGGTVTASSAGPDSGAAFTVRLPIAHDARIEEQETLASSPVLGKRRILVADDLADAAESLAMMLRLKGHEVFVAHDGAEALSLAARSKPQIAILDVGMPKLTGYDVAERIRAEPWGRDITLVALTGWGQQQDRERAAAAGFDRHLTKPADPEAIEGLLAHSSPGSR